MGACRICQGRAQLFGRLGELHAAKRLVTRGVAKRLLGGFGGMLSPKKNLNRAIWFVLEHIFIIFLLGKNLKIFIFYTKIMINCSHVLARGFRSMIHR